LVVELNALLRLTKRMAAKEAAGMAKSIYMVESPEVRVSGAW
jgi:hypothetical protein